MIMNGVSLVEKYLVYHSVVVEMTKFTGNISKLGVINIIILGLLMADN